MGGRPPINCRCLVRVTRSSMRTRVKLAGTKDMAKTTQMETSTSTEEAILWARVQELFRELCPLLMGQRSTAGRGDERSQLGLRCMGSWGSLDAAGPDGVLFPRPIRTAGVWQSAVLAPSAQNDRAAEAGRARTGRTRHSQCGLRQLLLGEVQGVVECGDAVGTAGRARGQPGVEECVVGSVDKGHHGVPALVVEPDLGGVRAEGSGRWRWTYPSHQLPTAPGSHLEAVLRV